MGRHSPNHDTRYALAGLALGLTALGTLAVAALGHHAALKIRPEPAPYTVRSQIMGPLAIPSIGAVPDDETPCCQGETLTSEQNGATPPQQRSQNRRTAPPRPTGQQTPTEASTVTPQETTQWLSLSATAAASGRVYRKHTARPVTTTSPPSPTSTATDPAETVSTLPPSPTETANPSSSPSPTTTE